MTSKEVSALLSVPVTTLDDWAHRRAGPAFIKVGRARRYSRAAIDAWLAEHTIATS